MIGSWELMVILFVILLLFGGKKLPEFAKNLGKGLFEFKKASQGFMNDTADETENSHVVSVKPALKTQEQSDYTEQNLSFGQREKNNLEIDPDNLEIIDLSKNSHKPAKTL